MPAKNAQHLLSIGAVSKKLGISISTLRRWDKLGKLKSLRTPGGQRRYQLEDLDNFSQPKSSKPDQPPPPAPPSHFQKPQFLLYIAIAAIATTQILYLTLLKVPHAGAFAQNLTHNIITLFQAKPGLSLLNQSLYTGTQTYKNFSQGMDKTMAQTTNLLISTARQATKQMAKDLSYPVKLARASGSPSQNTQVLGAKTASFYRDFVTSLPNLPAIFLSSQATTPGHYSPSQYSLDCQSAKP